MERLFGVIAAIIGMLFALIGILITVAAYAAVGYLAYIAGQSLGLF